MINAATSRRIGRPSPTDPSLLGEFGNVGAVMKDKLRPLTKHSFRRGAAQAIARLTGDPLAIQAMTGHKTIECLRRYIPDVYRAINLRASHALTTDSALPQKPIPVSGVHLDDLPDEPIAYEGADSDDADPPTRSAAAAPTTVATHTDSTESEHEETRRTGMRSPQIRRARRSTRAHTTL